MADRRGRSTTRSKSKDNVNDPRNWTNAKLRSKLQDLGIQTTVNFSRTVLVELYLINRKQRITTTATATTTRPGPTPIYPAVKTAKNTDDSTTDLPTVKILEKIYTAVIGDQVKLECSISGISQKTTVSWQRILPEGQTVTLDIDEIKYTVSKLNDPHLVINDIMKTDEGDYVFTISSVNGERKSARTKLKVNGGPPILNMKPKRHYKTEGDTAILKVNVIAEPPATNLTWTKNEGGREHLIANDNDKYLGGVLGSPSLIIAETEKSYDEGKYTCEAENHAGQGSNSVHLTIEKKYENTETDETTQNEGITERIKFRHAQMVNTLSKFIYPKANHWAQFIELAKAYVPNSELGEDLHHIISYLMQMDHISYGKYTKLFQIVNEIDKEAALIIKKAEADIETITKGGRTTETTAELECRFEGNYNPDLPQPCICQIKEQYRDVEGRIKGSGCEGSIVLKFTISEAQTLLQPSALYLAVTLRTRLENRKIVLKDESNEPLVLQTTPKVTIPTDNPKDIPTIRLSKGHYRFTEGKDVILKCVVVATVDTESIQWFRVKDGNSHAICIDNNKYFGGLSNSPSLAIADVKKSDRGIYFCKAKNSAGEVESDIAFVEIRTIGDLETRTADGSAEKRSVMEDTGGVKEDTGGVKEDTGGVKEDTGGVMKDTVGVMEDTGGVMEDLGGVMEDTGGVKEDTGGVKEDTGGVMEDTGGVMKDTVGVMKDTGGVTEDTGGVMKDTGGVMKDTGYLMKDTDGVTKDTDGVIKDTDGVMKDIRDVMEDTGDVMEDTGGEMEDTGNVMEDTGGLMKDTGGVMEETRGLMKDTSDVIEDTGGVMKDTGAVKNLGTMKVDVVKEELSSGLEGKAGIKGADAANRNQDTSEAQLEKIKLCHSEMVIELYNHFPPGKFMWRDFKQLLSVHLPPCNLQVEDIYQCVDVLMRYTVIDLGQYDELFDIVKQFDIPASNIIKTAELKIQEIKKNGSVEENSCQSRMVGAAYINRDISEDLWKEIEIRHIKMIVELSGYISPSLQTTWKAFKQLLSAYLTPAELANEDIYNYVRTLFHKEHIDYGIYDKLFYIVQQIDVRASRFITEAEFEIQEMLNRGQGEMMEMDVSTVVKEFGSDLETPPDIRDNDSALEEDERSMKKDTYEIKQERQVVSAVKTDSFTDQDTKTSMIDNDSALEEDERSMKKDTYEIKQERHVVSAVKTDSFTDQDTKTNPYKTNPEKLVEEKIAHEHAKLVTKLTEYISPKLDTWPTFRESFSWALPPPPDVGENLDSIVNHLIKKQIIQFGQYQTLYDVVDQFDRKASIIIKKAEARMKAIQAKEDCSDGEDDISSIKEDIGSMKMDILAIKQDVAIIRQIVGTVKTESTTDKEHETSNKDEVSSKMKGVSSEKKELNVGTRSAIKGTCRLLAQKYNLRDDCVVPVTDASNQEDLIIIYDPSCNTERKLKEFGEDVMIRNPTFVSYEGAIVSDICKTKHYFVKPEDKLNLKKTINQHTKRLFASHSNLNIITTSPVKSRKKGADTIECPCIVLVCSSKGYIPVGETRFPKELICENTSFVVDVREGYCQFCPSSYSTFDGSFFHQNIKMGCSFGIEGTHNAGTIGPFVSDFQGHQLFLTCAHTVNGVDQNGYDLNFIQNMFAEQPDALKFPNPQSQGCIPQRCGQVRRALFLPNNPTSVDAAVVEITEQSRLPSRGEFAVDSELNLKAAGFDYVPRFESGEIHDNPDTLETDLRIVKFGARTHVTRGVISSLGTSVKPLTADLGIQGQTERCVMKNQYEVLSIGRHSDFFSPGDSGSGVFAVNKLPTGEPKLTCIGMAIGCTSYGSIIVTPIAAILDALGLPRKLKQFP